jgi:replicative superfamily II helicase
LIDEGIVPVQCDIVENIKFKEEVGIIKELRLRKFEQEVSVKNMELEELFPRGYLRKSSLENNPSTAMSNSRTKLGNRVATEIFEYYESFMR